mmetsp:Transcript_21933/g.52050  ORF Transcript_21933/g.52050 Transcript_21933/m.52050 type:complete len:126 (+) Transcript_21933:3-380(+)
MLATPSVIAYASPTPNPERFKKVLDSFWWTVMFWWFLSFPTLASAAVENFNCIVIGDSHVLAYDVSIQCPLENKFSEVFAWAVLSVVLYPLGVPVFIYSVMVYYKVPVIANRRLENAILMGMLQK